MQSVKASSTGPHVKESLKQQQKAEERGRLHQSSDNLLRRDIQHIEDPIDGG